MLDVRGLRANYGGAVALRGVSLSVGEGEVVALMGRNGMGKTTTIRCVMRLMQSEGAIRFAGVDLRRLPAHRTARLGIGLVPEGRRCFAPLTVRENLIAAARAGAWDLGAVERLFPRLAERSQQRAATLSGGEQQTLTIGRALMTNPRLLILDEATEGLAPVVRQEIWEAILGLKARGLSILLVDKSLAEIRAVADRCVILERGADVWMGRPGDLTREMTDRYLGV
ncbi:ABC transporter ATP-binding protein [Rhodobacteraceae bacterium MCCB 386]|nr:ABC transporter ATP-binding protein [Roseitranquillus sediminis]